MQTFVFNLLAAAVMASSLDTRQSATPAVLDLAITQGTPQQLASGILYGVPDVEDQIPDVYYTGPKLNKFRAGGAQLFDVGQRGWHWNEYSVRFQSTLSNYRTARKYGGVFQLLPHDIWGTDTVNSTTAWPGDNDDWTSWDAFIDQLIADVKIYNMTPGLQIDIWNEPDNAPFWTRTIPQYLELWRRTYIKFRVDPVLSTLPLVGPSLAAPVTRSHAWWSAFFPYVIEQDVIPDEYTFHLLRNIADVSNDLAYTQAAMNSYYKNVGVPVRPWCVNEYINANTERHNSATAWHMARLERYNATGLRANWLSTSGLHDYLAELVYRPNSNSEYYPNGAWHMYRYYAQNMTGTRLASMTSGDGKLDIFGTLGNDGVVRILTGVRASTGTWTIQVNNLESLGFPASGSLTIQTWGFDYLNAQTASIGPSDRGRYTHIYSNGTLTFPIHQTTADLQTAWSFEFAFL
ncbi:hypothetical protein TruAng_012284 [Truncatella angustata]|nr:hypothetical protein TruAng_012284 [Truncatella angustata]